MAVGSGIGVAVGCGVGLGVGVAVGCGVGLASAFSFLCLLRFFFFGVFLGVFLQSFLASFLESLVFFSLSEVSPRPSTVYSVSGFRSHPYAASRISILASS